jgi:HD-like signal output (HDOD) protein
LSTERVRRLAGADNIDFIRGLFAAQIARGELELPVLPEIAARVVAAAASHQTDAPALSRLIVGDPSLAAHVMRIANSAVYQPRTPIDSLQQAIAWLGMSEVADIAFTVAVQGKLLNVPGQKARVQRMWRMAVGAALWSRQVAAAAGCRAEVSYLGGLLHEIGKPACLQAIMELSRRAATPLADEEIDALIAEFQLEVGATLVGNWALPDSLCQVVRGWPDWAAAGPSRNACAIVYLAHHLAEHMAANSGSLAAEALAADPVAAQLGFGLGEILALVGQGEAIRALAEGY